MKKIITIAHQKGGVGKSTLALNLAVELSKRYLLTVIDLDFQKSLTIFNEHRKEASLKPLEVIGVKDQKELNQTIKKQKGLVLIDSGGFDSDLNRLAILHSDLIITPLSNHMIEIYGLQSFRKILEELREIRKDLKSYVLLNNVHPNTQKVIKELKEFIQSRKEYFNMFDTVIRRRNDFSKSFEIGKSVVEINPKSKASQEILELIKEIEGIVLNNFNDI